MRAITKVCIFSGLLCALIPFICSAQNQNLTLSELTAAPKQKTALFQGEINDNHINVRSDSTVTAKIICIANKGEPVEVVRELYEWYEIRLPKTAPAFIRKDLVALIDEKTAKVIKDRVNIRLSPNESSSIIGKAEKNEVINILGQNQEWYRIEPLANSFGWVHKKFVDKVERINGREEAKLSREIGEKDKMSDAKASTDESLTIEGVIKPYGKVIKRVATHKLVATDNKVFLLKGNKAGLDSLNYRKVRVTGKSIHSKGQKYTTIEILKIEALD